MSLLVACTPPSVCQPPPTKRPRKDTERSNALLLLGSRGLDLVRYEIFPLVRAIYECRRAGSVAAFYSAEIRGIRDIPRALKYGNWRPPDLAAFDGDVKALRLLLRNETTTTEPFFAAAAGQEACLAQLIEWGWTWQQATFKGATLHF